ncbi:hypothetical protein Dxin01_03746 [Deinococcus xinjiangensis]|uniref:Uncharacterized protein n=1 Tax=Deinococcus xinjiangensis TaxID=457454 RepID=A0ABP9VKQ6_9DEIO
MGEGKPSSTTISTPATPETHTGAANETHGANTNLDPNMQGGPITPADKAATQKVVDEKDKSGGPAPSQNED